MKQDSPEASAGLTDSTDKLELLDYLLAEEGVESESSLKSCPSEEVREIPLSFAQQRLWFLDQMQAGASVYNIPAAFELVGRLNVDALHRALDEIVRRHEVLRTIFPSRDGQPFQVVTSTRFSLPCIDLREMPAGDRNAEVLRRLTENAELPFDLAKEPLFRASLLHLDDDQQVLLLCMHHIVSDGWSMDIFYKELAGLYQAFSAGQSSLLPELTFQYSDFSMWQREWLQGEVLEKQLDYWKRRLSNLVQGTILPADRPRPPVQTHRGARYQLELNSSLSGRVRALSRAENLTLFMCLLAAFKVLLYRCTGQEQIVVGAPVANRTRMETERLIGFFVNTLVLNTTLSGNLSFREVLARVRETVVGAFVHQDLPFEMLVDELKPVRSLSHAPLFQMMFTVQNAASESFRLGELDAKALRLVDIHPAKFDLIWNVVQSGDDLRLSITYSSDLFDEATITLLADRFQTLIESIVADPTQRINSLELLSQAERRRILVEWNDTHGDYPSEAAVHQLFEAQVESSPNALAVVFGANRWSYFELNRRANQLARYLRRLGVEAEEPVGVFLDRSGELIVALLGILKAGGAYVPLDPSYPPERLAFMVQDSGICRFVTEHRMLRSLPEYPLTAICLDSDIESIAKESESKLPTVSAGENAAYVVYTSGSTGHPKGVIVTHKAVNRLVVRTDYVQLKPTDVVAQVSNASFDALTFEVWGALLNGACLVGIPTDVVLSPKAFAAEIRDRQISAMFLTTALFDQMARENASAFRTVEHLLFGGEPADSGCVNAVLKAGPPRRLINVYGPTEATTFSSFHVIDQIEEGAATLPIGRPIKNCQIYVLDADLRPVTQGAAGELYIGGEGLARGYLNRPDLTAERFVPHPFSSQPGARLYRSGDLARYRSDGAIELLGRIDHQIKLRGFRIEPGEIEEALKLHPRVRQAVVFAHENGPGNKRLAACVVAQEEAGPTAAELRAWVQAKLPPYMRPAEFVFVDQFPLNANGKVDRKALSDLLDHAPTHEEVVAAPRDELESQLASIWQRVLNRPSIGIQDNFFELGGHSLLAVRLVAETERATGKSLSLSAIFQAPTIEATAALLRQEGNPFQRAKPAAIDSQSPVRRSDAAWSPMVALQPVGARSPFFWIHGETSDAFLPRYLDADQPVYGLEHQSEDGTAARYTTVEEIAGFYLSEMRSVQPNGPYFIGGYCFGGLVAWEIAQQLKRSREEVALLALLEPSIRLPLSDVSAPPLATSVTAKPSPSMPHEVLRHLQSVRSLQSSQRWTYIWSRVRGKVLAVLRVPRPLKVFAKATVCRAFLALGRRIPYSLRSFYILRVYVRALGNYQVKTYPDPVRVFVSSGSARRSRWSKLATGNVKIFEIPADHMEIRKGHAIQPWAEELRDALRAAQEQAALKSAAKR